MDSGWSLGRWQVTLYAVPNLPLIRAGDDLGSLICERASEDGFVFADGDVLVVASKVVSKAEGLLLRLADITPSTRAYELAQATGRDPRLCEVILQESAEVLGTNGRMIITRHRLGFHCTNAGVDRSNISPEYGAFAITLPRDPDASALAIRDVIRARAGRDVAVIISDSFGLPDRYGAIGLSVGLAGIRHVEERDMDNLFGQPTHSDLMLVDALAAAAMVLMGETGEARPVVVIRGVPYTRDESASFRGLLV